MVREEQMSKQYETLGRNLRTLRETLNLNQTEVAKYLGLEDHVVISYYENNKRKISLEHLNKLADLYGVDLSDLFEDDFALNKINKAFAFRKNELSGNDLEIISNFQRIVKNYLKMIRLKEKHDKKL